MKAILLLLVFVGFSFAEDNSAKAVFDLTTGDMKTFEKHILKGIVTNKNNYENQLREYDVAVVIHGQAYRFFVKDIQNTKFVKDTKLVAKYKELKKRISLMSDTYGVKFYMCQAALPKHGLKPEDIVKYVKLVPNSTMALIDRQNEGFAYLPVRDGY